VAHTRKQAAIMAAKKQVKAAMAKSKSLKSVIYSLIHPFTSRNNDVKGYWALGMLYSLVLKNNSKRIEIDLLNKIMTYPDFQFNGMIDHYRIFIENQMSNLGLHFELLNKAIIEIVFEDSPPKLSLDLLTLRGKPFTCIGTFVYEKSKCFKGKIVGFCSPHDPTVEFRSTRYTGE
jgi:hypothetical protein